MGPKTLVRQRSGAHGGTMDSPPHIVVVDIEEATARASGGSGIAGAMLLALLLLVPVAVYVPWVVVFAGVVALGLSLVRGHGARRA